MSQIENLQEKAFVSSLLFESVGKASAMIDTFSNWLLGGFAASIAFLIGNFSTISGKVPNSSLKCIIYLFLAVLVVGVIQKYLATIVMSASAGAAVGRELGTKYAENGVELDVDVVFAESASAILPPIRYFVRNSFKKASAGNITAAARSFTIIAQVQGLLTLLQAAIIFYAVALIANHLAF
ncbi:MAG TPA: hypothetical protein VL995_01230 [Cellvibrio sp.]|nr:hypothetical protein [Cellvibrio sp.]